ncbi:hypothetical protein A5791_09625 [Mycobacterium sp. 852002-51163_SCH5372311]|uniref:hypothetical protein n=1 Tax=Mycobacterium sp. 852002-51163_SCH5372311 TaxID=1834097 RepID=UPI0007FD3C3B|nr:hypothetical protein [Mycobacterium sp. 852002-51163_SCH5372311]OBF80005.1 hypothetical protein A5791_09625 [Mycobacterium sp. 852002-51163_SCH5372311]
MYQGPATLLQNQSQTRRVFWFVGGGILLLTVVALLLVPAGYKRYAAYAGAGAMLALYPAALSRSFKPKLVPVNLYVDQTGIYVDNAPLARREDITQAYIRPAFDKKTHRYSGGYGSSMGPYRFNITTPAYPLTLEMLTRSGQLNIDPGGEGPAGEILTALGIPVTTCAPDYRPQPSRSSWVATAVIIGLFLAAFVGYYFFMVHKTMHRH